LIGQADIRAIGALCKLAGCPERAPEFLTMKQQSGKYFSVAEISELLTADRVAKSEAYPSAARRPRLRRDSGGFSFFAGALP
jgi:hypothetical protein